MTQQKKRLLWKSLAATCLAMAVVVVAGSSPSRASGARESDSGVRAAATSTRKPAAKPGNRSLAQRSASAMTRAGMRDPFRVPPPPRAGGHNDELQGPLPPGVRGLVIGRLRLKGVVREDASNTMIAVVTDQRDLAYFLRVHDRVYNGVVSGITPDSIHFSEKRLNPGGQDGSREVVLKLGSER